MGYVYIVRNKINGMRYIGQTLESDIHTRWKYHKNKCKNSLGRYLLAAYNKYGIEQFDFKIICICFDEDCNRFEEEYIKKYNTIVPNGYNLREGGNNSKHHPDTLKLMSDRLKGKIWTLMTSDIRKKISEKMKGDKNPNYGKKITEDQKIKSRETKMINKQNGKKQAIHENSLLALKNDTNAKRVGKYDMNGVMIESYSSVSEAARMNTISTRQITRVCNNIPSYRTAKGFHWKFL